MFLKLCLFGLGLLFCYFVLLETIPVAWVCCHRKCWYFVTDAFFASFPTIYCVCQLFCSDNLLRPCEIDIAGTHSLIVFAGGQRCANNVPVSWLLVLLFENKKNWELLSKILHNKHLFVKLTMVQMSDERFPLHCCFTRELGKQIAILERALHELKIFWPWGLKDVKCHVQFSLQLTVNIIGRENWLCLEWKEKKIMYCMLLRSSCGLFSSYMQNQTNQSKKNVRGKCVSFFILFHWTNRKKHSK